MGFFIKSSWMDQFERKIKTRGGDFERPDQESERSGRFTLKRKDQKGDDVYEFWRFSREQYEIRYVTSVCDQQPYDVAPNSETDLQLILEGCDAKN